MFANYEYFVNMRCFTRSPPRNQFSRPSERNRSALAVRTVSARKKLSSVFGHCRSNSAESEFGFASLNLNSAMDFQYAIIASTSAVRSETLRDGVDFFIAMFSCKHSNAARFSFGCGVKSGRQKLSPEVSWRAAGGRIKPSPLNNIAN